MAGMLVAFAFLLVSCQEKTVSVTDVSLDRKTAEIKVGETLQLTATVLPAEATDAAVSWASDAPEVASVDADGKVTALKPGSAKITVTTMDGGMTATCAVTVTDFFTVRYFSPDFTVGGYNGARNAEDEMVESVFFKNTMMAVFVLSADGSTPYEDKDASHYSVSDIKAASGVIDTENQMVYVEKLTGVECGQYVIRFLAPGTAEFTLNFNDGTRSFSKTIKFTVEDKVHDIGFVAGPGGAAVAMLRNLYEGPMYLDNRVFQTDYYLWVRAWDKSTGQIPSSGTFSLDPDNDGESSALYEASVENVTPQSECIRIKFNTPGYINLGVRFNDGEKKKASARLCFYTYAGLVLRTTENQHVYNNIEFKLKEAETLSFVFRNNDRNRNENIVLDSLKLTGGNASIATLERAADGKTLVLKGVKEGTTSWTIAYSYFGMTIGPTTVKVTVSNTVPVTSVKIDNPSKTLRVGEKLTESVVITPSDATDKTVKWESSNPSVAKIAQSGGISANVEGVFPGTATITASCGGKSDSYQVEVRANYAIQYNDNAFAASAFTYVPGSTLSNLLPFSFKNSYTGQMVDPSAGGITITSSNTNVLKFKSYRAQYAYVEALSTGTATLKFLVGSQVLLTTVVTVVPVPEVHSQITGKAVASTEPYVLGYLSGDQVRFEMYDRFTGKYYNPTSGLTVSSSNTSVATASVGTYSGHQVWYVKALKAGTSTISFRYNGDLVKSITYSVRNDRDMVDLGLGVKWATVNIGASQPQEPGNLFAWGETQGKSNYAASTYLWYDGSSFTKYTARDGKMTLEADDDVAQVWWGWGWRMPTNAEFSDLCTKCTWTATTLSGVNVFKITGPNGKYIYIPLAGHYVGTTLQLYGTSVIYWTSERLGGYDDSAKTMVANKSASRGSTGQVSPRYMGMYVRAVKK